MPLEILILYPTLLSIMCRIGMNSREYCGHTASDAQPNDKINKATIALITLALIFSDLFFLAAFVIAFSIAQELFNANPSFLSNFFQLPINITEFQAWYNDFINVPKIKTHLTDKVNYLRAHKLSHGGYIYGSEGQSAQDDWEKFENDVIDQAAEQGQDSLCYISRSIPSAPVKIFGQIYDFENIWRWLRSGQHHCPVTRRELSEKELLEQSTHHASTAYQEIIDAIDNAKPRVPAACTA